MNWDVIGVIVAVIGLLIAVIQKLDITTAIFRVIEIPTDRNP